MKRGTIAVRKEIGLTVGKFNYLMLARPDLLPPVVRGRREWDDAHVKAFRRAACERYPEIVNA